MKFFLLGLMLVFGFVTNSADAIEIDVRIDGKFIPLSCCYFDTSLSNYGSFTIEYSVFLDWVEQILVDRGYIGITDVSIKHIKIGYVDVTVTCERVGNQTYRF